MKITLEYFTLYATIHTAALFLDTIAQQLRCFLCDIQNALYRCRNCGRAISDGLDECPDCGILNP